MPTVPESQKAPRWVERMREAGYDVRIGTGPGTLSPEPDAMFPPPLSRARRLTATVRVLLKRLSFARITRTHRHAPLP